MLCARPFSRCRPRVRRRYGTPCGAEGTAAPREAPAALPGRRRLTSSLSSFPCRSTAAAMSAGFSFGAGTLGSAAAAAAGAGGGGGGGGFSFGTTAPR